jgi:hypothetical protein
LYLTLPLAPHQILDKQPINDYDGGQLDMNGVDLEE